MKKSNYATNSILSILFTLFTFSSFVSQAQSNKWMTYKNKEYKFSVKFPSTPKEEITEGDGGTALDVKHLNETTGQMYQVLVLSSNEKLKAKKRTEEAIQTFVKEIDGTLEAKTEIDDGTEAIIKYGGGSFVIYQIHIVGNKMYQLIVTANSHDKTEEMLTFFDSFKTSK